MKKAKLTLLSVSIVLSSFFSVITPGRAQANRAQAISDTSAEPIVIDSSVNANTQSQMRTRTSPSGRTIVNITGGARDGDNLFHNFERFNVPIDATVRFRPLANVENVLSRVTGSDPSDILGTLAVGGSANLWLINPNGIIFGEQAVIDIDGSFYATTASGIPVDAAGIFSLPTLQNPGLLTVSTESGFTNYLTAESGDISILGSRFNLPDTDDGTVVELSAANILTGELQIGSNRTLSLFAYGDIVTSDLRDSNANGTNIRIASSNGAVSTGRININASEGADAGNVNITAAGNIVTRGINTGATANVGNAGNGGDIILTTTAGGSIINQGNLNSRSRAPVEDSAGNAGNGNAGSGGDIILQVASGGSIINEGILRSQSEATNGNAGNSGNITLSIAGRGDIVNERVLRSQSGTHNGNAGTGGNIALRTTNGSITNEDNLSSVSAATNSGNSMNGGSINISATGNIRNQGAINSYAFSEAGQAQNGGSIDISTQSGNILNNRTLRSTSTSNNGNSSNGGSIQIQTTADGSITNFGALNAQSLSNRSGNSGEGGDITLRTESGDIVNTSSGNIASASNAIHRNRGSLNTRSVTRDGNAGNAGDITVLSTGGNIVLNAYLDAKSYSINGNSLSGGDILVTANVGSIIDNTGQTNIITSAVSGSEENPAANGASGNGNRRAGGEVSLIAGGTISGFNIFTLSNVGESGDVEISGRGDLNLENIQIITNEDIVGGSFVFNEEDPLFPSNVSGDSTEGETRVTVPTFGTPGNVVISSGGNLTAENLLVSNSANSTVDAGDINISGPGEIKLIDSQLETDSIESGAGGTITIENAQTVVLDNTTLVTGTEGEGIAGNIAVEGADYVLLRNRSLLLTDAEEGRNGGSITINTNRIIATPDGNNDIITNASSGDGGNFSAPGATLYGFERQDGLNSSQLRSRRSNDISTRSEFGQDGSITLNDIAQTPTQTESEELDANFATPEQLISNSCISPNGSVAGSFTIPGAGDLPATSEDSTTSVYSLGDVQPLPTQQPLQPQSSRPQSRPEWEIGDPVVEPESVVKLADGRVVFGQSCSAL